MPRHHLSPVLAPQMQHDYLDRIDSGDDDDDSTSNSSLDQSLSGTTSATSYDISMRSPSPAPSVISMTNSIRENMLKQEHGRSLNNFSEVYALPADEAEWDRLEKQYFLMSNIMNKYPPPLYEIMRDGGEGTEQKRCLDLGCGNGSWIMDLARDFPNCQAVAVDLVPMDSLSMPPNLRSEVDDINLGLEHFYGDFDVVHAWLIGSGIKNYERLIDQISHVLRPGGLIDIMEFDFCLYDSNKRKMSVSVDSPGPPWITRFIAFVHLAVRSRGGDIDGIERMEELVQNHPLFEGMVSQDIWMPTNPQSENTPGILENNLEFLKSATPLLLNSGLSQEQFETLQRNAMQELVDGVVVHWAKLKRVYARKRR